MSYFKDFTAKEDWIKAGFFPNLTEEYTEELFQLLNQLNKIINENELNFDGMNSVHGTLNRIYRTLIFEDYKERPFILIKYEEHINELVKLIDVNKFLGLFIGNISFKYVTQKYFRNIDGEQAFVNLFVLDYINGLVKEFEKK